MLQPGSRVDRRALAVAAESDPGGDRESQCEIRLPEPVSGAAICHRPVAIAPAATHNCANSRVQSRPVNKLFLMRLAGSCLDGRASGNYLQSFTFQAVSTDLASSSTETALRETTPSGRQQKRLVISRLNHLCVDSVPPGGAERACSAVTPMNDLRVCAWLLPTCNALVVPIAGWLFPHVAGDHFRQLTVRGRKVRAEGLSALCGQPPSLRPLHCCQQSWIGVDGLSFPP